MSELRDISPEELRGFLDEFRELVFNMPFQIPHDLIFLARAVGLLSGMCAGLDPQFNVFDHMAPYAQKLLFKESPANILSGLPGGIGDLWNELARLIQRLVALPGRTEAVLARVERGDLIVHDQELSGQVSRLSRAIQRAGGGIMFAALLVSAVQLYLGGAYTLAVVLGVAALFFLIWSILPRSGQ